MPLQNGLSQFTADKSLTDRKSCLCLLICFSSLENTAQKSDPWGPGPWSLNSDNPSCWPQGLSLPWLWPNLHDGWHVCFMLHSPFASRCECCSALQPLLWFPLSHSLYVRCLYISMPRVLIWKLSVMRNISEHFRQNIFHQSEPWLLETSNVRSTIQL